MEKKSTILVVSAVALLLAVIGIAVAKLYAPDSAGSRKEVPQSWSVLKAVPSDALAAVVFDGSAKARNVIADTTGILQAVLSGENPAVIKYLQTIGSNRAVVSLHNSGSLVPIIACLTDKLDSASVAAYRAAAAGAGLKTALKENYLIASRSETFIGASVRHIEDGLSLANQASVIDAASKVEAPAVLLLSNAHAAKLLQVYSTPKLGRRQSFVKGLSEWTVLGVAAAGDDRIDLEGTCTGEGSSTGYFASFSGIGAQEPLFPEVLPYYTGWAVSAPVEDVDAWVSSRRNFEDGNANLAKFNKAIGSKDGRKYSPLEWVKTLRPKEVVRASFRDTDGVLHDALLLRSSQDLRFGKEDYNGYRGCLGLLFGESFAVEDSICARLDARWSVFGDLPAVRSLTSSDVRSYTLKDRLSDAGITLPSGYVAYSSFSDAPEVISELFSKDLAKSLKAYIYGAAYAPAYASLDLSSKTPLMRLKIEKHALKGGKAQVLERDTTVVIPGGYFPVKNAATGKTNYLYQNSHKAICLNDENNRGVWGVPFKESLCGRVQNIDFYHNGKIQFLFAAGSNLYAIDRLGHWVNGFPVELGKEVLLGPDSYDFSGAGAYTVMVLHKDNTLERYNLKGKKPEGWLGIMAPETVKNLPELLELSGRRFWVVRTSVRTLVYPFEGGETLTPEEGIRMIRPDAQLLPSGKGIKAACYDGKTRDFKLN